MTDPTDPTDPIDPTESNEVRPTEPPDPAARVLPHGPAPHRRQRSSAVSPTESQDISMAISLSRWQPRNDWRRYPQLFFGSALMTAVGLFLSHVWKLPAQGLVSVFLAAAALTSWFRFLIDENRDCIWLFGVRPRDANIRTALSVLAMFMGVFAAFAIGAALLGEAGTRHAFSFIFASAGVGDGTILERSFADVFGLIAHNTLVMLAFFCLAFVYHAYGALLTIAWNSAAWACVLVVLVGRAAQISSLSGPVFVLLAGLALLPHLVLEASAYVAATLASVFMSRALYKYGLGDPRTRQVSGAVLRLMGFAVLALIAAAVVESTVPSWALAHMH